MKRFLVYILSVFALACSSNEGSDVGEVILPPTQNEGDIKVDLYLSTRGPMDGISEGDIVAADAWEKKVNNVIVYLYYPADDVMITRKYNSSDFQAQPLSLNISSYPSDGQCECFVVANYEPTVNSRADLDVVFKDDITDYNGAYESVSKQCLRTGGFVMSAMEKCQITPIHKSISVSLDRMVAKVIFDINVSEEFHENWSGILKLGNVTVSNTSTSSPLFYDEEYKHEWGNEVLSQTIYKKAEDSFTSMFYVYENQEAAQGDDGTYLKDDKVLLTLSGTYDNGFVIEDVAYFIRIKGDGGTGKISRNKIYYVNGTIKTKGEVDLDVEVRVLDWENPIDQDVEYKQPGS